MLRSMPFAVDAVPSPGQIEIAPVQGKALKTSFTFSTNGWSDEEGVIDLCAISRRVN